MKTFLLSLTNKIYKILPLKEEQNEGLSAHIDSLRIELTGAYYTFEVLRTSRPYIEVVNTINYMAYHAFSVTTCRREVFKMLRLVQQLQESDLDD